MKTSDAFPSKWLAAADLAGKEVPVTVEQVDIADLPDGKKRPVLYFKGKSKGLILNRTNSNAIEHDCGYGDDMDNWVGKKLVLYPTSVDFKGSRVEAVRIRRPNGAGAPPPARSVPRQANDEPLDDDIPF
jgi:hypothetical protein